MAEAFLLLLAAGVMLAIAIPDPKDVTLNWLRLGGIISLALLALSYYFGRAAPAVGHVPMLRHAIAAILVLGQLAFVQVGFRRVQRGFALAGFVAGVWVTTQTYHFEQRMIRYASPDAAEIRRAAVTAWLTGAGVAMASGVALMDMLLGHAYLTASKMTIRPFRRLNAWLIAMLAVRVVCAVGVVVVMEMSRPVPALWPVHGFLVVTRWAVGLVVPFVFVLMAHECIGRRSTQSATGILYVAGVLVFVGELLGLYLAGETGLPF